MSEIWKEIKGWEGLYEVSDFGRVKNLARFANHYRGKRMMREKIIKSCKNKCGYSIIQLSNDGIRKTFTVHRLVAEAFIANPENKKTINHKDGNKLNNFLGNLEWATHSENVLHAFKAGLKNSNHLKKKVAQIQDGKILKVWESLLEAGRDLGICRSSISDCCRGRKISAGGFQWKFYQ